MANETLNHKSRINRLESTILLILVGIIIVGCSGSDDSVFIGDLLPTAESDQFDCQAESLIGTAGGIVEVTDASASLYGVMVDVPSGAFETDMNVAICTPMDEFSLPIGITHSSEVISIKPEETEFNIPVKVSIPYQIPDNVFTYTIAVYEYDIERSLWKFADVSLKEIDNGRVTILASNFPTHLVVATTLNTLIIDCSPGFLPSKDGFSVADWKDDDNGLYKWGAMVGFAKSYWETFRAPCVDNFVCEKNNLIDEYSECKQEQIIREYFYLLLQFSKDQRDWFSTEYSQEMVAYLLVQSLCENILPIVTFYDPNPVGSLPSAVHAVLVYSCVSENNKIIFGLYDPDLPMDDNISMEFNIDLKKFDIYRDGILCPQLLCSFVGSDHLLADQYFNGISELSMMPEIVDPYPEGTVPADRPGNRIILTGACSAKGSYTTEDSNSIVYREYWNTTSQNINATRLVDPQIIEATIRSQSVFPELLADSIGMTINDIPVNPSRLSVDVGQFIPEVTFTYEINDDLSQGFYQINLFSLDYDYSKYYSNVCEPLSWRFYAQEQPCRIISGSWSTNVNMTSTTCVKTITMNKVTGVVETTEEGPSTVSDVVETGWLIYQNGCTINWDHIYGDRTGTIDGDVMDAHGEWRYFGNVPYEECACTFEGTISYEK